MVELKLYYKIASFLVQQDIKLAGMVPETVVKNRDRLPDLAKDWAEEFTKLYKDEVWEVSLFEQDQVLNGWLCSKLYREDGYSVTDPDTKQRFLYKGLGNFHFIENRNGEEFERDLNWLDFDETDFIEAGKTFGYERNQVLDAYNSYDYDDVILLLEWVFELDAQPWKKNL